MSCAREGGSVLVVVGASRFAKRTRVKVYQEVDDDTETEGVTVCVKVERLQWDILVLVVPNDEEVQKSPRSEVSLQ